MGNELKPAPPATSMTPASESAVLLTAIAEASRDPNIDVAKMRELMEIRKEIAAEEAERQFNIAMSLAQSEMGRVTANATNTQTNSMYATYGQLDKLVRPIYTRHGFSLSFDTKDAPEGVVGMVCYVSHTAGHTRTYTALVPSDGKGARGGDVMTRTHAFGSGTSYGMRYLLKMIFNIAIGESDDDGNAAGAPVAFITPEQAATLRDMIEASGVNAARFLAWLKVESIDQLPAFMFQTAHSELKAQEKKRKGG